MQGDRPAGMRFVCLIGLMLLAAALIAPVPPAVAQQTRQVPVESLLYDLKNPDPARRKEAVALLGTNKVQSSIPALIESTNDVDADVRRAVVLSLASMSDISTLPGFVRLTADSERDIRESAVDNLVSMYLPRERPIRAALTKVGTFFNAGLDPWNDAIIEPDMRVDVSVIEALQARLQDPVDDIRAKAARGLGVVKGRSAVSAMREALNNDSSNDVRYEVARAFRKIGDRSVVPDLMRQASNTDARVKTESVYTLGRLRDPAAVAELTRLYKNETGTAAKPGDRTYQLMLFDALAFIADPSSKQLFFQNQQNKDADMRRMANAGLARIGDESNAQRISANRLTEKDGKVKAAQAFALYRMGRPEYLDELIRALDGGTESTAREYIADFKPEEFAELYPKISTASSGQQKVLVDLIGRVGDEKAIPYLQQLIRDRSDLTKEADQAIRYIRARTAVPAS
jgi:HEAT repeat protein